jgi:hypothetical protein
VNDQDESDYVDDPGKNGDAEREVGRPAAFTTALLK